MLVCFIGGCVYLWFCYAVYGGCLFGLVYCDCLITAVVWIWFCDLIDLHACLVFICVCYVGFVCWWFAYVCFVVIRVLIWGWILAFWVCLLFVVYLAIAVWFDLLLDWWAYLIVLCAFYLIVVVIVCSLYLGNWLLFGLDCFGFCWFVELFILVNTMLVYE